MYIVSGDQLYYLYQSVLNEDPIITYEPEHSISYKTACEPSGDSDQTALR